MERFRGVLKKRVSIMGALNGIAIVFIALMGVYSHKIISGASEEISDMIRGFQVGIFLGLQLIMARFILKYSNALKNDHQLKKLYIEEKDERTKLINDKIGGVGFNFVLGGVGTMTVMSGFLNQIVFITLLIVLIFIVLVKGALKVYYNNKF